MREPYRVEAEQLYPQPEINGIPLAFLPVSGHGFASLAVSKVCLWLE
jgi:hypothetical protein